MTAVADLLELPPRRAREPALDRGQQRCGGLPLPAARGRARGDLRRRARPSQAILERHPTALVAVEERGVGYRVNRHFPDGRALRRDDPHRRRRPGRRAGQPGDHPRPRTPPPTTSSPWPQELGLHGTNYVVGWTAWLDLAPGRASPRPPAWQHVADAARRRPPPTCSRSATAATTSRCSQWAGRGVAMGQAIQAGHRRRRRRHRHASTTTAPPPSWTLVLLMTLARTSSTTERLRLPLWTADEVGDDPRPVARRRGWHPRLPARGRPGRGLDVAATATRGRRVIIVRGRPRVGSIGFFGPPEPAADGVPEAEVGYGLVEEARGWGFATEALHRAGRRDGRGRRPGPGQRRAHQRRPASGCSPSAASPSCAGATRTASW